MPIYLLRHEERGEDPTFFSSLTYNGLNNANKLSNSLEKLDIDLIYCSPFLRTIQTIKPYADKNGQRINIENSLYESVHTNSFTRGNYLHYYTEHLDNNPEFSKIINKDYESYLDVNDIHFPENNLSDLQIRMKPFLNKLKEESINKNILVVTHMSPIIAIKQLVLSNPVDNIDYSLIQEPWCGPIYPMGHVEKLNI